jgi:hypothetical protein
MRIARDNPGIFSRQALAARRPEVGNAYLQHVHVPTRADFLRLQAHVGRNRKIYRARYGDLRNKLFAHKERMDQASINSLLAQTNIRELQRITVFLLSLESALWHLFTNGHKPILRPSHFSIASMRKHLRANGRDRSSQELVVHEIERFLSHASRPDIF